MHDIYKLCTATACLEVFFYVRMNRNWQQTSGRLSIIIVLKHPHLLAGCRCRSTDTEEQRADQTPHTLQTLRRPLQAAGDASPRARALKPCVLQGTLLQISTAHKKQNQPGTKPNNHVNLSLWASVIIVWYQSMHTLHKLFSAQLCNTISTSSATWCQYSLRLQLKVAALFNNTLIFKLENDRDPKGSCLPLQG